MQNLAESEQRFISQLADLRKTELIRIPTESLFDKSVNIAMILSLFGLSLVIVAIGIFLCRLAWYSSIF